MLHHQHHHAKTSRDSCISYFSKFSNASLTVLTTCLMHSVKRSRKLLQLLYFGKKCLNFVAKNYCSLTALALILLLRWPLLLSTPAISGHAQVFLIMIGFLHHAIMHPNKLMMFLISYDIRMLNGVCLHVVTGNRRSGFQGFWK